MTRAGKGFAIAAAMVAAIGLTSLDSRAYMGEDGSPPVGRQMKKMAAELGLTSQQQQAVKDVFAKNRPQAESLMKQLKTERHALRALIQADAVDEAAIRAQSAKVASVEAELAVQRAQSAQQIRAILTPEQILKFKELQAKRDNRMEEKRGHLQQMKQGN
jgi:Spy/CpxP family protein refolding chaperone